MFRTIWSKTLRDYRIAILAWGSGLGLLVASVLAAYKSVLGTPAAQTTYVALAHTFSWYSEPVAVATPSGFITWRYSPFLAIGLSIWAMLAGSRLIRGEEERGALDVMLSVPRSRSRVLLEKVAALATALLATGLIISLLTLSGKGSSGANFSTSDALLFGFNVALSAAVYGAIALLLAQFTHQAGTASGITGGILLLSFALEGTARVTPNGEWIGRLSPLYYYNLSKPLIVGYGTNPGAMLVLAGLAIVLTASAFWLFAHRDIGAVVTLPGWVRLPQRAAPVDTTTTQPAHSRWLRSVYGRSLQMIIAPTLWWGIIIAGYAAWGTLVIKQTEQNLIGLFNGSPVVHQLFSQLSGGDITTNAGLYGAIFGFLPLVLSVFALTQAQRWAADEEEGRLDLVLATPQSRLRVILGRFAALTTAVVGITLFTLICVIRTTHAVDFALNDWHVVAATLGMVPLALVTAALTYFLAGWLRAVVVTGIMSGVLALSFFMDFLGPALHWPNFVVQLSLFDHYGSPLVSGPPWGDIAGLLAVAAVVLFGTVLRFQRQDIG